MKDIEHVCTFTDFSNLTVSRKMILDEVIVLREALKDYQKKLTENGGRTYENVVVCQNLERQINDLIQEIKPYKITENGLNLNDNVV